MLQIEGKVNTRKIVDYVPNNLTAHCHLVVTHFTLLGEIISLFFPFEYTSAM